MYATRWCPYCIAARHLLGSLGVRFEEIDVTGNRELRQEMERSSGRQTVPQIWIGERHVGGFDDLEALHRRGLLLPLLDEAPDSPAAGNG
jgi:glutaredoxin 3